MMIGDYIGLPYRVTREKMNEFGRSDWVPHIPHPLRAAASRIISELQSPWDDYDRLQEEVNKRFFAGVTNVWFDQLKALFEGSGTTQTEIAGRLSISKSSVSGWFTEKHGMRNDSWIKLNHFYSREMNLLTSDSRRLKERAVEGCICVMSFIRREVLPGGGYVPPLTRVEFGILDHNFANDALLKQCDSARARQIILDAIRGELGDAALQTAPALTTLRIRAVICGWTRPYLLTVQLVPIERSE
jgi:hypothetical protein